MLFFNQNVTIPIYCSYWASFTTLSTKLSTAFVNKTIFFNNMNNLALLSRITHK